ncbi:ABC transporter permease [Anaerobium acetethylicum]|uniref:Ribose transport system permease protein n=1 Tax=Anaerobium acetethylicum TaxID=1619234 RepID=A0A1D3TSZ0_9FIRM|nr:ABC transporter permease [Anaerobium acetethylicum]SCP97043.1 ribose transport system permease protein [Anaerobium acetethylicum]
MENIQKKVSTKTNPFIDNPVVKAIGTQRLIAVLALLALTGFFSIASPAFRQWTTVVSIFDASYYIGFMAIGITFVIITGGIDLSIGTVLVCSSLIAGSLAVKNGVPVAACLAVGILIGALFGLCNGLMVSIMGLPPFIATLGTMMVSKGFGSIYSKAQSVTWPQAAGDGGWFRSIFKVTIGSGAGAKIIPTGFLLLIILAVIMSVILNKTRPGRYILALGSNKEATRLSGVNIVKWETLAYIFSGSFAGLAGIAYAASYSTMLPGGGAGFELDAIAGVVIGGTSMSGGYGSIAGTLIGVFIMSVLKTGLPFIGLQPHYQQFITGFVLIAAVFADVVNRRKKN